jgi:prephenate dehydrogenase
MQLKTFGIVGYGNFGQFLARSLAGSGREVLVTDADGGKLPRDPVGDVRAAPLAEVAASDALFLSVPFGALAAVIDEVRPLVRDSTVVADVVSTKGEAGDLLLESFAHHPNVLATHPLFGPPSMERISPGQRIVVTYERGEGARSLVDFFERDLGLTVERVSAEAHDHAMAYMQSLPFFIARALVQLDLGVLPHQRELSIPSFEKLRTIAEIEQHHTPEMFETSQLSNPFARAARRKFIRALIQLEADLSDDTDRYRAILEQLGQDPEPVPIEPFDFDVEESSSGRAAETTDGDAPSP